MPQQHCDEQWCQSAPSSEERIQHQHSAIRALREQGLGIGIEGHYRGAEAETQCASRHQENRKCNVR